MTIFEEAPKNNSGVIIVSERSLETKIEDAKNLIKEIFLSGKTIVCASSLGKDSSVLGNILLTAALEFKLEHGNCPHIRFVNSNTRLENPMMDAYSKNEIKKITKFGIDNGLDVHADIVSPGISNNYFINMIGGRIIASLSDNDAKCSVMMKVDPINRHKKRIFKSLGKDNVVTVVGKRTDESAERGRKMLENNEASGEIVRDKNGELLSSPIADFTLDDIFFYIGHVRSGKIKCYSDFDDLVKIYRDANGGDCMVNIYATGRASKTACGARSGCHQCNRVENDDSMVNMLKEESNAYMRPLNELREYTKTSHYDPKKRNWIARSLQDDGSVKISANAYSPQYCEELLKIVLTIDANEREEAHRLGIAPRFQMLSLEDTLSIEILWSRYAYHKAASALKIWDDIVNKGLRYEIPANPHIAKKSEFMDAVKRYSKIESVPFTDQDFNSTFSGFRDLSAAMADCEDLVVKNGKHYSNAQTDIEFSISKEGLELFEYFEWDNFLAKYADSSFNPTSVLHYFVGLGTINLSKGNHSQMDRMLRMANQIHRLGIRDILNNPDKLIEKLDPEQLSKVLPVGKGTIKPPAQVSTTTFSSMDVTKDQIALF